ncbi:uncharacterized protein LOC129972785 [Argiope bruennichi]|uniref:Uncharacterized protein n=1 Tax=Argiope bruennichi TaxID=94029 RepID=A0A8T0F787_ARGBR|nr:uncharacterized protein LOC129972785 [Argiope bruennichi]KAF8786105.1 hypothetical protein HNY73_007868 [Argiope bruennichi]
MKGLVILLLSILATVSSSHMSRRPPRRFPVVFPQQTGQESASSLGGAQVGVFSHTRRQPTLARFPILFARGDEYASSLVGLYNRDSRQSRRLVRARLPSLRQPDDSEYAVSLGGADVGAYRKGGRGQGSDVSGISLGKAPVGLYGREY